MKKLTAIYSFNKILTIIKKEQATTMQQHVLYEHEQAITCIAIDNNIDCMIPFIWSSGRGKTVIIQVRIMITSQVSAGRGTGSLLGSWKYSISWSESQVAGCIYLH